MQILHANDLCKGNDVFFAATGVSDGDLLHGVRYSAGGATSHSLVMRSKSGTVRYVETYHHWQKLNSAANPDKQTQTNGAALSH